MKNIAITAGVLYGNRGAEAMVSTCVEQILAKYPECNVHILSYYPVEDCAEKRGMFGQSNVYVHSLTPKNIVLNWFPMSFITIFVAKKSDQVFADMMSPFSLLRCIDAVFDVAGVSFMDGRQKFLPFNILSILPFIVNRIPVVKLSQAIGPIKSLLTKLSAKLVLPRLKLICARGMVTKKLIEESFVELDNLIYAPDISFLLEPPTTTPYEQRRANTLGVLPSSLVMSKDGEYPRKMANLIKKAQSKGFDVVLIVHSWRRNFDGMRNNDIPVAKKINELLSEPLEIVGEGLTAKQLKVEVGKLEAIITSRFHGMVAGLSTSTPTMVVGWSHKYLEVLNEFGFDDNYCVDFKNVNDALLEKKLNFLYENRADISSRISQSLPGIKKLSMGQFEKAFQLCEVSSDV